MARTVPEESIPAGFGTVKISSWNAGPDSGFNPLVLNDLRTTILPQQGLENGP